MPVLFLSYQPDKIKVYERFWSTYCIKKKNGPPCALSVKSCGRNWNLFIFPSRLSNGEYCQKLEYNYNDQVQNKGYKKAKRGVCHCAEKKGKCVNPDKQENTLIPWCLPHTSNRYVCVVYVVMYTKFCSIVIKNGNFRYVKQNACSDKINSYDLRYWDLLFW